MKFPKILSVMFLMLLISFGTLSFSACGQTKGYEVSLSVASDCQIDTSNLEVKLFDFDGTLKSTTTFTNGKAAFAVENGNYVATLSSIGDEYDYQVAFLIAGKKSATITIKNAEIDNGNYLHSFSVYIKNFNAQNNYRLEACEKNVDGTPGVCYFKNPDNARVDFDIKFKDYSVKLLIANVEFSSIEKFSFNDANRYVIL